MASTVIEAPSENPLGPCPAFVFGDVSTAEAAIIVIQEWWGANQNIKDVAKLIGEKTNCVTLVPDLYRGKVALDRETAGHYSKDLNWPGAVQDVDACARYLKSKGIKKVGATGFCQGGALSIAVVTLYDSVDAAAPFYGIPRPANLTCDYSNIKVPLQCHFGEKDQAVGFSSKADYEAFQAKLKEYKVPHEFYTYDAGHAFANKTNKESFNEEAYNLSFSRMFEFFEKHLKN
ncbi:protein usf-like [Biomphalaria glabrata]|uniref:Protein usf-like n=1 Tax=Biomphalaria glabrata TaxID=6526 RepID=A0A9U8EFU9_BIOGL|nr:protein usf-like [Biomphalaria glabrata]XP_013085954.2 protein usf-like [Biomphalaria glabrata]KAI8740280.1 protein usf-like [Biomphalaria glabrata]KAI8784814.1 protein usf [Biomphalaria glabrata]